MERKKNIIVYSPVWTNRLRYIIDQIFEDWLKLEVQSTDDANTYKEGLAIKVNYSSSPIAEGELWIPSNSKGFLIEKSIKEVEPMVCTWQGLPCFFFEDQPQADFPFDLFAMFFFLLSRYEEYLPHDKDMHGRYAAENSLAYKNNFLHLALVDHWLIRLKDRLCKKNNGLELSTGAFSFIPTYDIDYAWAFKYKGIGRSVARYGKTLMEGRLAMLGKHLKTNLGLQKDPFDQFEWMDALHQEQGLTPIYFFQVGDRGAYDKNVHWKKNAFQRLIQNLHGQYTIGLHPSYQANKDLGRLKEEKRRLETITGATIHKSRQHFVRIVLPTTYRLLMHVGITDDYSMGYARYPGFRASVSRSFLWYDLEHEMATQLRIHPFCLMDGALKKYQGKTPEASKTMVKDLYQEVGRVGGTFISIWHNSSFSELEGWKGWKAFYEWVIQLVVNGE